jgi:predicted DNA-binding protein (UPF0251 family)
LGSYLSDGSGYNKSKFKPILPSNGATTTTTTQKKYNDDRAVQGDDPLPWLRLPNLDFVEVAGQTNLPQQPRASSPYTRTTAKSAANVPSIARTENSLGIAKEDTTIALEELELLRLQMQEQVLLGNIEQAMQLQNTLERLMKENNIQFTPETEPFQ